MNTHEVKTPVNGRFIFLRTRGFTLVELMVALALSTFLIGALIVTYISGRAASLEAEQLSRTQENLRFASDFIVRDLRNAGFRDEGNLPIALASEIGSCFAKYGVNARTGANRVNGSCVSNGDNSRLTIRYAGLGACGLAFQPSNELKMIENTYFVDNGRLVCSGTEVEFDSDDNIVAPTNTVVLASGLESVQFSFLFPDGVASSTVCNFLTNDDLATACIGVEIEMTFEGQPQRSATLTAAFRNVALDRLFGRD